MGDSKRKLIACETLRDEVELTLRRLSVKIDIVWMDNTLHAYPEKLRGALQETVDGHQDADALLFAYGNCGNGLVGLKSEHAAMVIPKFGDCIDMFLCNQQNLERIRTTTYFLTKGWLDGKQGLEWEIDYNFERFGEKRAKKIMDMIYHHYKHLMLIDTGAYDKDAAMERVKKIAAVIGLEPIIKEGDLSPLEKLVTGNWEPALFCVVPPGKETTYQDFDGTSVRLPC